MARRHRPATLMARWTGWSSAVLRAPVARGAAGALTVRAAGSALAFGSAIVLTRALGAAGYGAYAWAAAWIIGLARPAGLGATLLLTRQVAAGAGGAERSAARELAERAARAVAWASAGTVAVLAAIVLLAPLADATSERALLFALPALPAIALVGIPQGVLQGLGRPATALLPATLFQQAPFLLLVVSVWWIFGDQMSSSAAAAMLGLTSSAALVVGVLAARRALPSGSSRATSRPSPRGPAVLRGLLPLALVDTAQILHASCGIALLGIIAGPREAGLFAVATLLTGPLGLALVAGSASLAPVVASRSASGDTDRLRYDVLHASRVLGGATTLVAAAIAVLEQPLLSVFGPEFGGASDVLLLLLAANVVNGLAPFNGLVLIMTGHEWAAAKAAMAGLGLVAGCSLLLIPAYGAIGAAAAYLVSTTVRNVINSVVAWRALNIDTTVWGRALPVDVPRTSRVGGAP